MSVYRHLIGSMNRFKNEKIRKDLKNAGHDVQYYKFEFYSLELPFLSQLDEFFISLMPIEDHQFVKLFKVSKAERVSKYHEQGLIIDDSRALEERMNTSQTSTRDLQSGFTILNSELYRIYTRIQKKLIRKKDFKSDREVAPKDAQLKPLPKDIEKNLIYFLESVPALLRELKYVKSKVQLDENSEQVLSDLVDSVSETQSLSQHVSIQNFKITLNNFTRIFAWIKQQLRPKEDQPINFMDCLKVSWKMGFFSSYETNAISIILDESFKLNTELLKKVNVLVSALKSFDQMVLKGRKHACAKPKIKAKQSTKDDGKKLEAAQLEQLEVEPSSEILPNQEILCIEESGGVKTDELKEHDHSKSTVETLRRAEEKQLKGENANPSPSSPPFYSNQEAVEIYSRFSEDSEQSQYAQIIQSKMNRKDLVLLDSLFSRDSGGIAFDDLNRLIKKCGGIVEQARGSHVKITMPGKKFFSAYRPHGSGHTDKVRNFLLDIYRKALVDVRDKILR